MTNPIALLTEGALLLERSSYGVQRGLHRENGRMDNIESALGSGDYSAALTDLENGPTTILCAFLNGYSETLDSELIPRSSGYLPTPTPTARPTGGIDALRR